MTLLKNGLRFALFSLSFLLSFSSQAFAQSTFTLDRAQLSGAPEDGFMVMRPYVSEKTRYYFNSALGYSLNPLRSSSVTEDKQIRRDIDNPIQSQFLLYPSAGIEFLGRFSANLTLPVVMGQITGDDPKPEGIGDGGLEQMVAAVGDLRIDLRGVAFISGDGKSRIGGVFAFTAPTSGGNNFGGDSQGTAELFVNAEHNFGGFFINGHIGPQFRPQTSIGGVNGDLRVGSELRYAFGAFLPLRDNALRLGVELWGSTGIQGSDNQEPSTFFLGRNTTLEWLAQARFLLGKERNMFINAGGGTRLSNGYGAADLRLLGSFGMFFDLEKDEASAPVEQRIVSAPRHYEADSDGDGFPDGIDSCPDQAEDGRGREPNDGCPAPADADGDGLVDSKDACVDQAEDYDGIQDTDGCPEEDADNDSVNDEEDACPLEPGPASVDAPGCPSLTKINASGSVDLLEPIAFERGRAKIKEASFAILDEIVALMRARPSLRLAVHGHTDNVGSFAYNFDLSEERAASVMTYLIDKGIDPIRLESEGFGPDKPIDTNDTPEGRARNRRVEFIAVSEQNTGSEEEAKTVTEILEENAETEASE